MTTWKEIISRSNNTILVENSTSRIRASLKSGVKAICVAATASQLDLALQDNSYKNYTLWLDYDLTRIWKIGNRVNTLDTIKKYKKLLKESGCQLIVIHSWNPWGRRLLEKELRGCGVEIIVKRHWRIA